MPEPFLRCFNPAGLAVDQLCNRPAQDVRVGSLNEACGGAFGACEKVTTCARIELTTLRTKERLDIIHAEGVQCLARAKNCVI
jgi:hypothetical protein